MPYPNLCFLRSDITYFSGDAIVNAANAALQRGGGVDGAIHRAAGPGLQILGNNEIKKLGRPLNPGEAVITGSAGLRAKFVIHAVGPIWKSGNEGEREQLREAYSNCLEIAQTHRFTSIAFPNISTGIYGFPKDLAAEIALETVTSFFKGQKTSIEKVVFVIFDDENLEVYRELALMPEYQSLKEVEGY